MSKNDYKTLHQLFEGKQFRIYFNNPQGMAQNAIYTIENFTIDNNERWGKLIQIRFKGYGRWFNHCEISFCEIDETHIEENERS